VRPSAPVRGWRLLTAWEAEPGNPGIPGPGPRDPRPVPRGGPEGPEAREAEKPRFSGFWPENPQKCPFWGSPGETPEKALLGPPGSYGGSSARG